MNLQEITTCSLESPIILCRALPLRLGSGGIDAVLLAYSNSAGSNPWIEMFSFPADTLKLAVFDLKGKKIWHRDLGPGVIPDGSFCPIFAFDMDGDGKDEIYFLNNTDPEHPFAISKYRLERSDAGNGRTTGQWQWPGYNSECNMNNAFRNTITGGYVHGKPVLVTAQGLYDDMYLQAWNPDMSHRWELTIAAGSPGARGSHMHPIVDINSDGVDELMWGERCLSIDNGKELFCFDSENYCGHSDIIQPFIDPASGRWLVFSTREKKGTVAPRISVFDATGKIVWGDLDRGHIHIGWVARLSPDKMTAMAIRIGSQIQTKKCRQIFDREIFAYDASSGKHIELPFDPFQTIPVDLNGDGIHELVRGTKHDGNCNGEVLDGKGQVTGSVKGTVSLASKILNLPGEQLLTYAADGAIRIWADLDACDSEAAKERYRNPFYDLNQRLSACGNHLHVLGGI
ncbi:MAG TPA: polysaccharide lyase 11 [Lentisphaeria bacterium]|nr:MAG: hypothetical protein A2X48_17060 [Lentisphaerae bacterium GWF2_49_21]HBC88365.1 polysaccharide lyase 11 [Lentisphaeria bacterium]